MKQGVVFASEIMACIAGVYVVLKGFIYVLMNYPLLVMAFLYIGTLCLTTYILEKR